MISKTAKASWQQDLVDELLKAVYLHFSTAVSYEQVYDYIMNCEIKWNHNEELARAIYNMYTDKLKKSGNNLSDKMNADSE